MLLRKVLTRAEIKILAKRLGVPAKDMGRWHVFVAEFKPDKPIRRRSARKP